MSQPPAASPLRVGCFPRSRGDEPEGKVAVLALG